MENLNTAIGDLRGIADTIAEQEVIGNLSRSVEAIRQAADDASLAVAGLPELVETTSAFVKKTSDLPLAELADDADALLKSIDGITSQDSARAIPEMLNTALDQLSSTLAELRDGGLIENANKTLDATNIAAGSIADATTRLPEIVARIEDLLGQAESTLAGLDRNGPLTTETRATLREIRDAASAVNSLARTIERRPNSLLIGR
jgi:paraquat-inducible protein B